MGLHLCYELDLPSNWTDAQVTEPLRALHQKAATLHLDRITPLRRLEGRDCQPGPYGVGDPLDWFLKVAALGRRDDDRRSAGIGPTTAIGFVVAPGLRCEPAAFGVARYPEPVTAHPDPDGPGIATLGWHWHTCCKTQYASVVSDDHLLRCHLALVALLDEARSLGFTVTVRDETHYWETRDTKRLVAEVHQMNRLVARLAGRLSDVLGPHAAVGGSITAHPEFEHLEMESPSDQ